jgi:hypothetical protein
MAPVFEPHQRHGRIVKPDPANCADWRGHGVGAAESAGKS